MSASVSDVVVIGAGPAGSAAALFLARAGYAVTLVDRAVFPRPKPCGEYLTPGAVGMLRDEIGVLPALLAGGARPLTQETVVPHQAAPFGGATAALACPRTVTDSVLRNAAQAAGVRVLEGFQGRRLVREGDGFTGIAGTDASGEAHTLTARVVVGADGTKSLLARALGVVRPLPRLQKLALVTHFHTREGGSEAAVTMHLPRDGSDACCGVGAACGPEGTRNVNIVVPLSEGPQMAGRRQEYFEERLRCSFPAVSEMLAGAVQVGPLHSVGCFGHHTVRTTADGAVLVGDAATFIHPFTGEGVFFALRGAQLAAEAIDGALRRDDVSARSLASYDRARRAELLPRYRLCDLVQRVVHCPPALAWAAGRLRRSAPLTELILQTIGDLGRPADLLSVSVLRLALSSF